MTEKAQRNIFAVAASEDKDNKNDILDTSIETKVSRKALESRNFKLTEEEMRLHKRVYLRKI